MPAPDPVAAFVDQWQGASGSERANYQLFITALCALLDVPPPEPARDDTRDNGYVFWRRVTFAHGDGSTSSGFIDCYRRGAFVLEAKKIRAGITAQGLTKGFDDALMRARAEQLDAHRKRQQAAHPDLTLTGLYNVLEKLRHAEPLSAKDKLIHEHGLVSVLKSLHDELDAAVLAAYGWSDLTAALAAHGHAEARAAAVDELLQRLVALNARPAAEEADEDAAEPAASASPPAPKRPWPTGLPEQIKAVADVLASAGRPLAPADLEARFAARGRWRDRLPVILETLEALGRARRSAAEPTRWQAR